MRFCARWKTVSLHGRRGKPGCATRDDTFVLESTKSVGRMIVIVSSYRASSTQDLDRHRTFDAASSVSSKTRRYRVREGLVPARKLDREPAAPEHELEVAFARHSATMRLMIRIDFEYGALSVDAALIAEGPRVDAKLRAQDTPGKITSVCEPGVDRDAG